MIEPEKWSLKNPGKNFMGGSVVGQKDNSTRRKTLERRFWRRPQEEEDP